VPGNQNGPVHGTCGGWKWNFCDNTTTTQGTTQVSSTTSSSSTTGGTFQFDTKNLISDHLILCASVETTPSYTQCNSLTVSMNNANIYFPNGITCGPVWSSQNSRYSDTAGFCSMLTGGTAFSAYYACDITQTRAVWRNSVWSTFQDNGFTQHLRCYY